MTEVTFDTNSLLTAQNEAIKVLLAISKEQNAAPDITERNKVRVGAAVSILNIEPPGSRPNFPFGMPNQ